MTDDTRAPGPRFGVLGPLEVVRAGRPVTIASPKQRALLVLLLTRPGRFASADWLADALWDGAPPPSAETTLRTHVAGLRRVLEPGRAPGTPGSVIRSRNGGYQLVAEPGTVDLTRFELLTREAAALTAGDPVTAEQHYAAALDLWRGDPLPDVADLAAARPDVERLRALRLEAQEGRLAAAVEAGRHLPVLAELQSFVAAHPLREAARAQLMLALYRSGRQAEALAQFDQAHRLLADGYGLDPGERLRTVHRAILAHDPALAATSTVPAPPDQVVTSARTPASTGSPASAGPTTTPRRAPGSTGSPASPGRIVAPGREGADRIVPPGREGADRRLPGRDAELAVLAAAVAGARGGAGRAALLVGEAGVGKTSVAAQVGAAAERDGVPVVWARCPAVGQAPPFWVWIQVVRELAGTPGARDAAAAGALAALGVHAPDQAPAADPAARFRLYEAVAELTAAAAAERGLIVVLDDLHAADPDSLLLLRYLAGALARTRALVLATARPYHHDTGLVATVAELARGSGFTRLDLSGLAAPAVDELVSRETGARPAPAQVAALLRRTGGNPFFITELLRHGPADGADLPPTVRDTVCMRLDALPSATRAGLDLLAVAGQELDLPVLADVLDVPAAEVAEALVAAHTAHLLVDAGPGRIRFAHPLFAEAGYAVLSPPRQAALHARLAGAYERRGGVAPAEIAHHYGRAAGLGHDGDHLRWLLRAADDATRRLAYEDALAHLDRAAALLAATAPAADAAARELAVQLQRAALLQVTVGIGSDAVDRACVRARELLDLVEPGADPAAARWMLAELAANRAEYAICLRLAAPLAEDGDGDGLTRAAGSYLLGAACYFLGRLAEAEEHLSVAADRLSGLDPRVLSRQVARHPALAAHNFRALVRSLRGDRAAADADLVAAAELAERLDDPYGRANALLYAAWLALQELDAPAGDAAARRFRELGLAHAMPHFVTTSELFAAWAAVAAGDGAGRERLREGYESIYRLGLRATRTVTLGAIANAHLVVGDPAGAARLAEEGLALVEQTGERVFLAELLRVRAVALADPAGLPLAAAVAVEQGAHLLAARVAAARQALA